MTLDIIAEHCYAECHLYWLPLMPSVTYKPVMPSVVMLNVIMLIVMALKNLFVENVMILLLSYSPQLAQRVDNWLPIQWSRVLIEKPLNRKIVVSKLKLKFEKNESFKF